MEPGSTVRPRRERCHPDVTPRMQIRFRRADLPGRMGDIPACIQEAAMPPATREPPPVPVGPPEATAPRIGRPEPRGITLADLLVVVAGVAVAAALTRDRGMP